MPKGAAVFVIVTLAVIGTVGAFDLGSTAAKAPSSPQSSCSDSVRLRTNYGQSNGTLTTTVFRISPGSTATVCITYPSGWLKAFIPSAGPLMCGPSETANASSDDCSGKLTVVASGLESGPSSGLNVTVAYTLRASEDAEGVFWFWVDCGELFPVSVGLPPSSLTFPIIPGCVYEPNAPSGGHVTGVSNMSVEMIRVG